MTTKNTIPDINFVIDPSDKELFIMMKSLVDTNFPQEMQDRMNVELWKKKRRYKAQQIGNTVYISFPSINIFVRLIGSILMRFTN
jgi:hypothetical protein